VLSARSSIQYTPYPAHYAPLTQYVISEEQHAEILAGVTEEQQAEKRAEEEAAYQEALNYAGGGGTGGGAAAAVGAVDGGAKGVCSVCRYSTLCITVCRYRTLCTIFQTSCTRHHTHLIDHTHHTRVICV
jgi:hypothetical protein